MLDTRLALDTSLRCDALYDRVAATPIGINPHALRVMQIECDTIEASLKQPLAICRVRDIRHWLNLAYGHTLHGYPPAHLRNNLLNALAAFAETNRAAPSPSAEQPPG